MAAHLESCGGCCAGFPPPREVRCAASPLGLSPEALRLAPLRGERAVDGREAFIFTT